LEKIKSRLTKQVMFQWLEASLRVNFTMPTRASGETFSGIAASTRTGRETGWHPDNWVVGSGRARPLPEGLQPALKVRAIGSNAYWHTERFVADRSDGRIRVEFEARNSVVPSRHRVWIFEDGSYRSVGEFVAENEWRRFEIPVSANPGSVLEFQIDQSDDWQWLSIRDFKIIDGGPLRFLRRAPVAVSMEGWTGGGGSCAQFEGRAEDCRHWLVDGKEGYVQTPELPRPGERGLLIRFEARTDRAATTFTPIYLFEGEKYRVVAESAFDSQWRTVSLLLQPNSNLPLKLQVDYPESIGSLLIRNFKVTPLDSIRVVGGDHAG
jgi:hypothetical protein